MGQPTEIFTLDLTVDEYKRILHALSTEAGRCREVAEDCRRHIAEQGVAESDRATPENWENKTAAAIELMNELTEKMNDVVSYDFAPEPLADSKPRLEWSKRDDRADRWYATLDEHRLYVWTEWTGSGKSRRPIWLAMVNDSFDIPADFDCLDAAMTAAENHLFGKLKSQLDKLGRR